MVNPSLPFFSSLDATFLTSVVSFSSDRISRVCLSPSPSLSLFGAHIPFLADHYGPAEIVFVSSVNFVFISLPVLLTPVLCQQGQFQEQLPPRTVLGGTKWCVFKHGEVSRATVESAVRERMTRMRTRQLDFLQVSQNRNSSHVIPSSFGLAICLSN